MAKAQLTGMDTGTLLQLVKTGGKVVLPYVPSLVDKFVALLSSLEPEAVNYLHLNAEKYNTTGDDIDRMRLSNVRGSPMMDAIERCLDLLDGETMKTFIPQLQKTVRKALGLPSKVGQIFMVHLIFFPYHVPPFPVVSCTTGRVFSLETRARD